MCGRHACTLAPDDACALLKAKWRGDSSKTKYRPGYNICPGGFSACLFRAKHGRELAHMRWGFRLGNCGTTINARSETLTQKRAFMGLVSGHRCVLVSEGFYEWQKLKGGQRQPYFFHPTGDRPLLLAALYTVRAQPDGSEYYDFVVITVPVHDRYAAVHDRMPAVIDPDLLDIWLGSDTELALSLLVPTDCLEFYQVSHHVSTITNDGPKCIEPLYGKSEKKLSDIRKFLPSSAASSGALKREVEGESKNDLKQSGSKREKSSDTIEWDYDKPPSRVKREKNDEQPPAAAAAAAAAAAPTPVLLRKRSQERTTDTKKKRRSEEKDDN